LNYKLCFKKLEEYFMFLEIFVLEGTKLKKDKPRPSILDNFEFVEEDGYLIKIVSINDNYFWDGNPYTFAEAIKEVLSSGRVNLRFTDSFGDDIFRSRLFLVTPCNVLAHCLRWTLCDDD
jgi:hypothetical protein